jgi:2'-5' RNA ligase
MTGYHDYLILLSPGDAIINIVKDLKDQCANKISDYDSRHSKAHITVAYWPRQKPEWVEPLLPKLERDLMRLSPAELTVNNFDYFEAGQNRTIYAKLEHTPATDIWFKQLRKYFSKPDKEPHITIAKNIGPNAFGKLWPYFKKAEWNEQFKIEKLTILRRETFGFESNYKVVKELPFNKRLDFDGFTNARLRMIAALPVKKAGSEQFSLF